jgi:putative transposase
MEAYVNGVSTRSVDDLVGALGADSGINKSEVSRICAGLDDTVGVFRTRRLDHLEFPTSISTPPTCTCATRPSRCARWRW